MKHHRPHSYHTWMALRRRCRDKKFIGYRDYGGRGITVCEAWFNSFDSFLSDMGRRPDGLTIHRKDNNGGYWCGHCKECRALKRKANCVWATREEQSTLTRRSRFYTFKGKRLTRKQLADKTGVDYFTLRSRIDRKGWSVDKAVRTPLRKSLVLTFRGKTNTVQQWSELTGVRYHTIMARLRNGLRGEPVFSTENHAHRIIEWKGVRRNLIGWARKQGLHWKTISRRLDSGMDITSALTK